MVYARKEREKELCDDLAQLMVTYLLMESEDYEAFERIFLLGRSIPWEVYEAYEKAYSSTIVDDIKGAFKAMNCCHCFCKRNSDPKPLLSDLSETYEGYIRAITLSFL